MSTTTSEQNKALVPQAFDTLFNKRDGAAAERFRSSNYIQHSVHVEPGRERSFQPHKRCSRVLFESVFGMNISHVFPPKYPLPIPSWYPCHYAVIGSVWVWIMSWPVLPAKTMTKFQAR